MKSQRPSQEVAFSARAPDRSAMSPGHDPYNHYQHGGRAQPSDVIEWTAVEPERVAQVNEAVLRNVKHWAPRE